MRRNWISILVFALALVIQTSSPAKTNAAMKPAPGVERSPTELCLQQASGGEQRPSPAHRQDHHESCQLCQVCCDGVAPNEARLQNIGLAPVLGVVLAWTEADRALPTPRHDSANQPRAPPALS